jgi:hypothetical protein
MAIDTPPLYLKCLDTELVGLWYLRVLECLANSVVDKNELSHLNKFCNGLFHLTHLLKFRTFNYFGAESFELAEPGQCSEPADKV